MEIPVVGGLLEYARDPKAFMRAQYTRGGAVTERRILGRTWTLVGGPDACEAVLKNRDKAFANGPGSGFVIGPFFNRGLMLLDFSEHHRHRRLLQEAFTRPRIEGYAAALAPAVSEGLNGWTTGAGFLVYPAAKNLTLDLATQIFMGGTESADSEELDRINRAFVACVQAATGMVRADLPFTRWRRGLRGRALLDDFLRRQLSMKRAQAPGERDDLFSILTHLRSEEGEVFSDDDIVNHMIFLLMAAHDTSTITVAMAMYFLGQHPDWQERCRLESRAQDQQPDLNGLESLTSLDLVIKETLRLVPPVPILARQTVTDTEIMGVPIPEGRLTAVMLHLSHHLEDLWTDPSSFDPDRFNAQRREDKSHRFAWEPFGGGVHKCLGMAFAGAEVTMILHQVLRRFEWSVDADYVAPLDYRSLPFPRDGLPLDLRPLRARIPS